MNKEDLIYVPRLGSDIVIIRYVSRIYFLEL
jgi:hypothetical protein